MKPQLPIITGVIARRVLVNFRIKPELIAQLLPSPFRPKQVKGWAIAGICLIRLEQLRPKGLPAAFGISTENAAHRIAVEWDDADQTREGVYVPRRETATAAVALTGGRLFPGEHHRAQFKTEDDGKRIKLVIKTEDGLADVSVTGHTTTDMMPGSIFQDLSEASQFFCNGSVGCSPNQRTGAIEVMELHVPKWEMKPLVVEHVHSAWFADTAKFPAGTVDLDSAFIMRGVQHEWHAQNDFIQHDAQGAAP